MLLALRREPTARLPLDKMKFLWEIAQHFAQQLERLSGCSAYSVRQAVAQLLHPVPA